MTATLLGLLLIVLLISSAAQSRSTSATPSGSDPVGTTDPSAPASQVAANPDDDPRNDVKLLGCSWTSDSCTTKETVNVRVTNRTDTVEFYSVDIGISDAQGHTGTATVYQKPEDFCLPC